MKRVNFVVLVILLVLERPHTLKAQDIDAFLDGPSIDEEPISEVSEVPEAPEASAIPVVPRKRVALRDEAPVSSDVPPVKMPDMEEIEIKNISNSGRSLIVDRGSLEGLRVGQLARLYLGQTQAGGEGPTYSYIAEAEIIKVHRNYSFWLLRDTGRSSVINPDSVCWH